MLLGSSGGTGGCIDGCGRGVVHPMPKVWTTDWGLVISWDVLASLAPALLVSTGKPGVEDRFGGSCDIAACFQGLVKV